LIGIFYFLLWFFFSHSPTTKLTAKRAKRTKHKCLMFQTAMEEAEDEEMGDNSEWGLVRKLATFGHLQIINPKESKQPKVRKKLKSMKRSQK